MTSAEREEWLRQRRSGIGGSDIAAVCGLSPYRTAFEVYCDKLGLLPSQESEPMYWGHKLEPVVAAVYAERTGNRVRVPDQAIHRRPGAAWCLATPDRLVEGQPKLLECKTARAAEGFGTPGTDEVPEGYLLQCQWQMSACPGVEAVDLAVLIAGSDFRVYCVPKSAAIEERLLAIGGDFWGRVERRDPPALDYAHPEAAKLLGMIYSPVAGTEIELDEADALSAAEWESLGEEARNIDARRDAAKARLIARLQDTETGVLPDGRRVEWKKTVVPAHERKESTQVRLYVKKARSK